jgi:hypothetical protein
MKYPVTLLYSDDAPDVWEIVTARGDCIHAPELAGMYNKLVSQYNALYHELAEYLPYAAPGVAVDNDFDCIDHCNCPAMNERCRELPCVDCDLNAVSIPMGTHEHG